MEPTKLNVCDEKDAKTCPYAVDSAEIAVKKVFAILGVDVEVPKEVEEFRQNLRFGATMRRAVDKGIMTAVGVIFVSAVVGLWSGIISKLGG